MKKTKSLHVAATYVGAIIGAGFASGQEILQFFVVYNNSGLLGIIISGFLFSIIGVIIVNISYDIKANNYKDLFFKSGGKKIGVIADIILTLFLVGSLVVMLAGIKSIFKEIFPWSPNLGLVLTIILIIWSNYHGIKGIMNLNLLLIPILIIIIVVIFFALSSKVEIDPNSTISSSFLTSSFIYTAYNLILALTVLIPLTASLSQKDVVYGVSIGGIILGLVGLIIAYILNQYYHQIATSEIPMLDILKNYKYQFYYLYTITLWLAMLTTSSCNLYALITRLSKNIKLKKVNLILSIMLLVIPFSQLPFSKLVQLVYLYLGKISLLLFLFLFFNYFIKKVKLIYFHS